MTWLPTIPKRDTYGMKLFYDKQKKSRPTHRYVWADENGFKVCPTLYKSMRFLNVGESGSGKTNTNQVINSVYHEAGWKLIVFDPESEYWYMKYPNTKRHDWQYEMKDLQVLIPKFNEERKDEIDFGRVYQISWNQLESGDIINLINYKKQISSKILLNNIMKEDKPKSLEDLINIVGKRGKGMAKHFLQERLMNLQSLDVITKHGMNIDYFINSNEPVVFDFEGCAIAEDASTDFMVGFISMILKKILLFRRAKVLVTLDEAVNLLDNAICAQYISKFIAMGRKRLASAIIATQYPLDIPRGIFQNCQIKMFHRTTEPRARAYISKTVGVPYDKLPLNSLRTGEAVVMEKSGIQHRVTIPLSPVAKQEEGGL